jgi:LysM repeat protein
MNRTATTLATLTASFLLSDVLLASDPTTMALEARVSALEARLNSVEATLANEVGSSAYKEAAMLEATQGAGANKQIPAPPIPDAAAPAAPANTGSSTYVIQDGDTLGKIAAKFNIERKALLEANRLGEGQPIYIGETLVIPGQPVSGGASKPVADSKTPEAKKESVVVGDTKKPAPAATTVHTVAKGDTLTSLAKKYGTTVESLKSANGLRSDTISLGQALKIPAKESGSQASAPTPEAGKPEQSSAFQYDNPLLRSDETYGFYTVAKGDNLYALARDFFTTMAELQRINNLGSSTTIFPGNDLIVPTSKYNAYHQKGEVANR